MSQKHWLIRVGDGENFKNGIYNFWGVKRGSCKEGGQKTIVKKIVEGDILWFFTSKKYGGKIIGMAEYTNFYDRKDEPLIQINTLTNKEQNWKGDDNWDIQINYTNLYNTDKQNIQICIQCGGMILEYDTFKDNSKAGSIKSDLYMEYGCFKRYAEVVDKPTLH